MKVLWGRRHLFGVFVFLFFGALSCFCVWEQDVFWQMRAGKELVETFRFPLTDSWSFTGAGGPWMNFQWISSVLLYFVHFVSGISGLVVARGVLAGILFLNIGKSVRGHFDWGVFAFLCLVYVGIQERIQIRPDFMAMAYFAWSIRVISAGQDKKRRLILAAFSSALMMSLHPGGAVFFILAASFWFLALDGFGAAILATVLMLGCFCVGPYGWKVLPYVYSFINYSGRTQLPNPDHLRVSLEMLQDSSMRLALLIWVAFSILASVGIFLRFRGQSKILAAGLLLEAILFAMSANRIRAFPYQFIFSAPFIWSALCHWKSRMTFPAQQRAQVASWITGAVVLLIQVGFYSPAFGLGINENVIPVEMVERLSQIEGVGRIYTQPSYGQYLLWEVPQAKISIDTREMMYADFQETANRIHHDADFAREWLRTNQVDAIAVPVFKLASVPGQGLVDLIEKYYPREDWALVFYDQTSMLLIRRALAVSSHLSTMSEVTPTKVDLVLSLNANPAAAEDVNNCMGARHPHIACQVSFKMLRKACFDNEELDYLAMLDDAARLAQNQAVSQKVQSLFKNACKPAGF